MKTRLWTFSIILTLIVLSLSNGCKKDDNSPANTVKDVDGNVYQTVTIGTQTWMVENLKTTKFNDGTDIPLVADSASWAGLSTPGYCWYNNDEETYKVTYGALYNWYAVNTGKLCPNGWHVPTDAEWKIMEISLGMMQAEADDTGWRGTDEGNQLKSTSGWKSVGNSTNTSGFSALGAGCRTTYGTYENFGYFCYWWSSTEQGSNGAWLRNLFYDKDYINRGGYGKKGGFSIRCVRN